MPDKTKIAQVTKKKVNLPRMSIAVGGERMVMAYTNEEKRVDDLKITDYRLMIDNDGQMQMIWNAIVNTILSAGIDIKDDANWLESNPDIPSPELEFIQQNLTKPYWQGGMVKSMELVNRTSMRAFVEGFRCFEIIYRIGKNGFIEIDYLAPRAGNTDNEFHLVIGDNGEWVGFRQQTTFKNKIIDVSVLNDTTIKKVVKSTFGEEFGSAYGRSGLKAAYYHYDKAHKGMYLNHVGHELGAVKFRRVAINEGLTEEDRNSIMDKLERVHLEQVFMHSAQAMDLFFEDVSDANVMKVGKEMINYHAGMMAKSVMAQFLDLGSNISETGSRATEEGQQKFFKQGLQTIATLLIEDLWNPIIAELVRINFNNDIYPSLRVNPIDTSKSQLILDAFLEMVKKGNITDGVKKELLGLSGKKLGLDVTEQSVQDEMEEEQKVEQQQEKEKIAMQQKTLQANINKPQIVSPKKSIKLAEGEKQAMETRPLHPVEEKVRFADINRKLRDMNARGKIALSQKVLKQKGDIINDYIQASRQGLKSIDSVKINLQEEENKYSEELMLIAQESLNFGKITVANELTRATGSEKKVPDTSSKQLKGSLDKIDRIINKQQVDLGFRLSNIAADAYTAKRPEDETKVKLEDEYDDYWDTTIPLTIGLVVATSYNDGREISFDKYKDLIAAYMYTAVLDDRTTEYCRTLDGRIFDAKDPARYLVDPPNHYNCRSQWTEITKEEMGDYGVEIDGLGDIPTFSSVDTFKNVASTADLSEKTKRLDIITTKIKKDEKDVLDKLLELIDE